MKVFVAFSGVRDDRGCVGVFTTEALAQRRLERDGEWQHEQRNLADAARRRQAMGMRPMRGDGEPFYDIEIYDLDGEGPG